MLNFIKINHKDIEYITLWWLWDNFLHPKIINYFNKLKTLSEYNISFLIPTKWISLNEKIIKKLFELKQCWININLQIWIFSIKPEIQNIMCWVKNIDYYNKFNILVKLLKNYKLDFAMELLLTKYSEDEVEKFYDFCSSLNIDGVIHRLHNFWWKLSNYKKLLSKNSNYNAFHCSFNESKEDNKNKYYNEICWFFPFINYKWDIYPWTFCMHYHIWKIYEFGENNWMDKILKECYKKIDLNNIFCKICIENKT